MMARPVSQDLLTILRMSEEDMMGVDVMMLYKAFYALPTRHALAMCNVKTGRGFERLAPADREVAERIVRVVERRCPMPKIERWKNAPAQRTASTLSILL